jgi:hypothetical protein
MAMPKNCAMCERWSICECLKEYKDYESILYAVDDGDLIKADGCPLIEIPPHSDLVDRDALIAEYDRQHKGPAGGARKIMEMAPTVIEAEGREE